MLSKENRLKKNKHFNYIYKHGEGIRVGDVSIVYVKAKIKPFKVGFSVSSKVGKAVVRNLVKRRMREAFKELLPIIDRRYNYIFVAKEGLAFKDYNQIKQNMLAAIKKAGLYNEVNS
ncbi:MAG: ribonuclease P protein component [Clostridiales bacterium]|nr:ribonuclease P protein component [Clostridiales bacterium]